MTSNQAVPFIGRGRASSNHFVATSLVALIATILLGTMAHQAHADLVLWNKLGSTSEVLNSSYGPNLGFFSAPGGFDDIANPDYVPGVFGGALTIGPGNYFSTDREHNVVWSGVDQSLNPDRGTISMWYKQNSQPVNFDHGVYRLFDGAYGLTSGIGLWSQSSFPAAGPPTFEFHLSFGGPDVGVSYDTSSLTTGTWVHVAGVWDRAGIAGSADTIRFYLNGSVVASTTDASWGTTVGADADIAGGNDGNIAGQFAVDNLKVYNTAVTDFSDRFTEGGVPEPATGCLALIAMTFLGAFRTRQT